MVNSCPLPPPPPDDSLLDHCTFLGLEPNGVTRLCPLGEVVGGFDLPTALDYLCKLALSWFLRGNHFCPGAGDV